ncbi:MAG: MFS transporter [Promethearchaeota archaeon]|jgi:MFS family permease
MKLLKVQLDSENRSHTVNKFSLVAAILFAGISGYAYFAFFPLYLRSIGYSEGIIIFIMIWMGVGMAIFSWIFGRISDRTGRRKLFFILALIFQVVIFILIPLNNNFFYLSILTFFRGLILGMRMPVANALFADIVEKSNKKKEIDKTMIVSEVSGSQLSILSATKSTGWSIGVLLSSFVIATFNINALMIFLISSTAIALIFAIPVKDVKEEEIAVLEDEIKTIDMPNEKYESPKKGGKVKIILFLTVFFRQFGLIPFLQIISVLLTVYAGIPEGWVGIIIALNPILQIVAMIVNGRLIDNPRISERLMLAVGFILSALTLLCYTGGTATGSVALFILGQICLGFGWGFIYTGAVKYIVNRAPMDRAFYMGIWITDLQIAKISSYIIFAFLWEIVAVSPTFVLPFAIIGPLIGLVLVIWL